jgi:homoserine dehydrogenase
MGILNGTTNYILTRMSDENMAFDEALKIAQEKGFAEADPTFDIEGFDAGHKIAILAMLAFNKNIEYTSIPIEGIKGVQPIDIAYAHDNGYTIKLLAMAKKVNGRLDISVRPTMISETHPLGRIREEYNAVLYDCNMTDPVILSGRGAGGLPTASAVISDVVQIVESKGVLRSPAAKRKGCEYLPAGNRVSRFYLRMCTLDSPASCPEYPVYSPGMIFQ